MMKNTWIQLSLATVAVVGLTLSSCSTKGCMDEEALNYDVEATKDDGSCEYAEVGEVEVQFNYIFGATMIDWEVGSTLKHPKTQDTLTFSEFKFYVSEIVLVQEDGTEWSPEENAFLVCAACPDASRIKLEDVPAGQYVEIKYQLGLSPEVHTSGPGTGDLAEAKGMFLNSTDGYIMLLAEGASPQSPTGSFTFHLSGFTGDYALQMEKRSDFFDDGMSVVMDGSSTINMTCNPARLWHSAPIVSEVHEVTVAGEAAHTMATAFFENIVFSGVE